ncbi:MAG TPA: hypothetical protein DEP61_09355, partial [Lachnospiraceae bacterium]|nr:hypothetical protein [Lachnospiraceae bacterium]
DSIRPVFVHEQERPQGRCAFCGRQKGTDRKSLCMAGRRNISSVPGIPLLLRRKNCGITGLCAFRGLLLCLAFWGMGF